MKITGLTALILLLLVMAPVSAEQVDGTDAIYLAGRTDITVPPASDPWDFLLRHVSPTPEEAMETHPDYIPVVGGLTIRAAAPATGGVDFFNGIGFLFYGPDGNGTTGSNLNPIDGISGYIGPEGPLAGVFLDDGIPDTGPAVTPFDFTPGGIGIDFSVPLEPELGQVFFIGDGFNSVPEAQTFIAPAGATRLFLGIPDGFGFVGDPGAYDDNDGAYFIDFDLWQADADIKFCSDPNAFNCKKKGVLPVTIFGSASVDVDMIDPESLQLCTAYPDECTGAPKGWSIADRGDPASDLGASSCAIDPDTGLELDTLTTDDIPDIDVAFEASEVQALLGEFCSGDRNAVSDALFIVGTTFDGTTVYSTPVYNSGIDQLVKKN